MLGSYLPVCMECSPICLTQMEILSWQNCVAKMHKRDVMACGFNALLTLPLFLSGPPATWMLKG